MFADVEANRIRLDKWNVAHGEWVIANGERAKATESSLFFSK